MESGNQLSSEFKAALVSNGITVTDADLNKIAVAMVTCVFILVLILTH